MIYFTKTDHKAFKTNKPFTSEGGLWDEIFETL